MKPAKRNIWPTVWSVLALAPCVAMAVLIVRSFYSFIFTDFVVRNTGPTPIRIIAMGTMSDRLVAVWSRSSPERQKVIPPGEERSFRYGWNDVNLCWLLVDAGEGRLHVMGTPLQGKRCELSPPTARWPCCTNLDEDTVLTVPAVEQLDPAPEALTTLVSEH